MNPDPYEQAQDDDELEHGEAALIKALEDREARKPK